MGLSPVHIQVPIHVQGWTIHEWVISMFWYLGCGFVRTKTNFRWLAKLQLEVRHPQNKMVSQNRQLRSLTSYFAPKNSYFLCLCTDVHEERSWKLCFSILFLRFLSICTKFDWNFVNIFIFMVRNKTKFVIRHVELFFPPNSNPISSPQITLRVFPPNFLPSRQNCDYLLGVSFISSVAAAARHRRRRPPPPPQQARSLHSHSSGAAVTEE